MKFIKMSNTKFLNNFKFLYGNKIKKNKIFDILH